MIILKDTWNFHYCSWIKSRFAVELVSLYFCCECKITSGYQKMGDRVSNALKGPTLLVILQQIFSLMIDNVIC